MVFGLPVPEEELSVQGHVTVLPHVITQSLHEETILLNTITEKFISLNDVGAVVWESLKSSGSPSDAVKAVQASFDTGDDESGVRSDVDAFIVQLVDLGVVKLETVLP